VEKERGMTPYYDDGRCVIYHGDCREMAPSMGRFGLLLTDPPYGLGDRWSGGGTWQHHKGIYAEARKWDQQRPDDAAILSLVELAAVSIVWGGNLFSLPVSRCWLTWHKNERMDTVADFEMAWTSMDKPSKSFDERRNPDGRREHPTQKPLSLMSWCIRQAGSIGPVLDPFMGSGTTLRAAKDLGLLATGIEMEERYCEIAARRLSQEVLELGA
jgi:site-specific DNA-methyltransferase (adenine-specific)